ncbi:uncharacterized protein LOC106161285 [Lingula anatina]|uniref:Uncharacterized protein LOC106161285 n=1 Tax=Lingula anatina TaxID=7574 RepID=A0A1S3I5X2_LINAN|nr:uncharacterized protein LOC106161285 [Lingula anatina]XP_013393652.1 uncharacterized protein LOC106161285 [Lingula anatina]XP_013393659.1 uncharacterized protein LOC106161285 [Lingula anatina]|eukprot:XP_013393646.1 uncharacterized protein LOC106161285 [Lingula anatina]
MGGRYSLVSILNTYVGFYTKPPTATKSRGKLTNGSGPVKNGKNINGEKSQSSTPEVTLLLQPSVTANGQGQCTDLVPKDTCDNPATELVRNGATDDGHFIPLDINLPRNGLMGDIGCLRFEADFSDTEAANLKIKDLYPESRLLINPQEYGLPQKVRRFRHYYYLKGVRKVANGNRKLHLTTVATTTRLVRTYRMTEAELIILITKITRITRRSRRVEMTLKAKADDRPDAVDAAEPIQSFNNETSRILHSNKLIAFEYTPLKNSITCY